LLKVPLLIKLTQATSQNAEGALRSAGSCVQSSVASTSGRFYVLAIMMKLLSAFNMSALKLLRVWLGVCMNLPKEGCPLVHHFLKKEELLKMEDQRQSITITHSKVKVLRSILDAIFKKT
jgi:hypothetical protein